jgi:hypothetical protein
MPWTLSLSWPFLGLPAMRPGQLVRGPQLAIGFSQWIYAMTTDGTSPTFHPYDTFCARRIEKLPFSHNALTALALHDWPPCVVVMMTC